MISIYSNNFVTDFYIKELKFPQVHCVFNSIEEYIQAPGTCKIAFVNHINTYQLPESEKQRLEWSIDGRKFFEEVDRCQSHSDLVFAFDNEIHPYHIEQFEKQQNNVVWAIPGRVNQEKNYILWNLHFSMQVQLYKEVQLASKLQDLQHRAVKPRFFDALLGQSRLHRDYIYKSIVDNKLQEKILTTYLGISQTLPDIKKQLIWEPDIENFDATITRTPDHVQYCNQQIALCRIVPVSVYNQCAYSIVAETGHKNYYSFFTEKTAKPIIARRLFVVFSGRNFLHNLKSLGFKTFDNVIDESYDSIYNDQDRWSAAFEQVKKLCEMDQQEVFAKIAPTVEHNYSLLMNTNWGQCLLDQLQQKINQHLVI